MKKITLRAFLALLTLAVSAVIASAQSYSIPAGSGTLSYTATVASEIRYDCDTEFLYEIYAVITYSNFSYTVSGSTYPLTGTDTAGYDVYQDYSGTPCQPNSDPSIYLISPAAGILFTPAPTTGCGGEYDVCPGGSAVLLTSTTFYPSYKVASVLYSPPGNQSSQGYGSSTTYGTTTTITNSFTSAQTLTYSGGPPGIISVGETIGFSNTSTNSTAFSESWTDATSIATDDNSNKTYNPTGSDAINHNLDSFVLWVNPEVIVYSNGATPVGYTVNSQPTTGVSAILADILPPIPAITMEPLPGSISETNPSGISSVPVSYLIPQAIASENGGGNSYMPGLGAICKNNSLYLQQLANPTETICTQANQCGCAPSDFVQILQTDPLLNYNGTTYTASPYPGTVSPLELDTSGATVCNYNPLPANAMCRYAIVPIESGSTTTQFATLSGSAGATFAQTDSTVTTQTLGESNSFSEGISFSVGVLVAQLKVQDTWTWTDGESWGGTNGESSTMSLTLKTSTAACGENVNIYEDTVYHTFVFQVPTGNYGCN